MKIKKFWIAIQVEKGGKYSAVLLPVTDCTNVYKTLADVPGIVCANVFDSRTAARATVSAWVDGFRAAGCFMWDTMPDGSPAPF